MKSNERKFYEFICTFYESFDDEIIMYRLDRECTDLNSMIDYFDEWLKKYGKNIGLFKDCLMYENHQYVGHLRRYKGF